MTSPAGSDPILDWSESALRTVDPVRSEWATWLSESWHWDWFFTGTFAPREGTGTHTSVGWSLSDRLYREWVTLQDEKVATGPGVYWVRAREPHQFRNASHFHALIGGVGNLSRREAWAEWFERNGQARIEPIRGSGAVALYVAKYINKTGGELVFSENAGLFCKER